MNKLKPHAYAPSGMHMGDCSICGHLADAEIHTDTPPNEERVSEIREAVRRCRDHPLPESVDLILAIIDAALERARRDQRKACAMEVRRHALLIGTQPASIIAEAISALPSDGKAGGQKSGKN